MLRLVMFDFDGVISDSEPAHYEMFRQVFEAEGIVVTWPTYCEKYLGYDDQDVARHVLTDFGQAFDDARIAEICEKKKQAFADHIKNHCVILPGVQELLDDLRSAQVPCSICSGALRSEILEILKMAELGDYFQLVVAADDVEKSKPDPQGYLMCLEQTNQKLGHNPVIGTHECIIIEDSMWGIQAASAAGIHCVAVTTSYPKDALTAADTVVKDLTELTAAKLQHLLDYEAK